MKFSLKKDHGFVKIIIDSLRDRKRSPRIQLDVTRGREANIHRRITGKTQKRYHILRCLRDK